VTYMQSESQDTPSAHACGEARCRVCRVLGFIAGPPRDYTRKPHHPLNTARARKTAERIHTWMLDHQREHARSPKSFDVIAAGVGLRSAGLCSLYLHRLAEEGKAQRAPFRGPGRRYRWEAIELVGAA
jgi:hypothetical protein